MQYRIVEALRSYELEKAVNNELKNGWKLQGGVCTYPWVSEKHGMVTSSIWFSQAMVKE